MDCWRALAESRTNTTTSHFAYGEFNMPKRDLSTLVRATADWHVWANAGEPGTTSTTALVPLLLWEAFALDKATFPGRRSNYVVYCLGRLITNWSL